MQLLNEQDSQRIESHLGVVIDRHLAAPGLDALREKIRAYVLAGGKRVRPQLVAWTYELASGEGMNAATLDVAAGWELFHAFLLVHDDIIDGSAKRRDRPALHHELASLDSDCLRFGTNLGIVAGDLLFSAAMCLWHNADIVDATRHRDLLRLISRIACTTGFGQAIDICASHAPLGDIEEQTLLLEYHWKTAAYTFEGPMLSGAILAGLGEEARAAISKFSLSLGQAYQLQNDLDDLSMPARAGCDLMEGKRTLTLLRHRASLDDVGKASLDARLKEISTAEPAALGIAERLRGEMQEAAAAIDGSRKLIASLVDDARAAVIDPSLPPKLAGGMSSLLAKLCDRYFVSA